MQSWHFKVAMAMTTLLTLAAMFGAVRQNTPRVGGGLVVVMLVVVMLVVVVVVVGANKEV